ncbi:MAG: hypothetical protein ABR526_07835 [Chthoniobacterales bacterium]
MSQRNFFAELKRRNVYKIAVAYAVVAWLLIQAGSILFPTFEAPAWVMKVFIAAILSGFPIALILAWAFELTPSGIVPTEEVPATKSIARKTGRRLIVVTVIVGLIAAGLLAFQLLGRKAAGNNGSAKDRRASRPSAPAAPASSDKSIAVLPFENLSDDKANAFFASGIQDEILTSLAKISGLKVISRTSTARYGASPENLPEIAKQLGVAHILEGSVQKAADKVHINVQLIRADSDAHVWAQSYDRSLADIFAVEAEVARSIADELRAALSPEEKARVSTKPTQNPEAYVLYLRANEYSERPSDLLEDEQSAAELYTKAIGLDPTFAVARARLASVLAHTYLDYLPTAEVAARARAEADEALRLKPDLADAHHARGMCLYWIDKDYDGALFELENARRLLPNNADVIADIAYIRRRQGRWQEARVGLESALNVDPGNAAIAHEYMRTLCNLRDWTAATRAAQRAVALAADSAVIRVQAAYVDFWAKGDLTPLFSALAAIPSSFDPGGDITLARWDAALANRDFDSAEAAVAACRTEKVLGEFGAPVPKSQLLGTIALARGRASDARRFFEDALPAIEAEVASLPLEPFRRAQLALLYAYLERKDDAIREARRAVELRPESRDHLDGALFSGVLALVYARSGEPNQAIPLIERLLSVPFSDLNEANITLQDLRHRWQWDPLRSDPRFQKILAGPEPKTTYD